jgi:hypothetical protein
MKKSFMSLSVALVFCMSAVMFIACSDPASEDVGSIYGTWVSPTQWGNEEWVISSANLINRFDGAVSYSGTLIAIREESPSAGYITIRFTENLFSPEAVGNYYVIHYKNLSSSSVEISAAYSAADPDNGGATGKADRAMAENSYTVQTGYFTMYSACTKQ